MVSWPKQRSTRCAKHVIASNGFKKEQRISVQQRDRGQRHTHLIAAYDRDSALQLVQHARSSRRRFHFGVCGTELQDERMLQRLLGGEAARGVELQQAEHEAARCVGNGVESGTVESARRRKR
jgi:hypothetical protein